MFSLLFLNMNGQDSKEKSLDFKDITVINQQHKEKS